MVTVLVGVQICALEKIDNRFVRLDEKVESRTEVLSAHFRRIEDMLLRKFAELVTRPTRIETHPNLH
jgi:hypothetical protein